MTSFAKANRQPQGVVALNRASRLSIGAQVVVTSSSALNLVSNQKLETVGPVGRAAVGLSVPDVFRKNSYRSTELLSAIGAANYVEFWQGYPRAFGAAGGAAEAAFVTGSSNNLNGISISGRSGGTTWGAVYNWPTFNYTAEVLALDVLTTLLIARYQDRMELWRDGLLIATFSQSPISYPAHKFNIGTFIQDIAYWASSTDTVLAGRVINTWTTADIQSFFANPWQILQGQPNRQLAVAVETGSATYTMPGAQGTYTLTGNAANLRVARRLAAIAGSYTLTGKAAGMRAARRMTAVSGSYILTGNVASLIKTGAGARTLLADTGVYTITGRAANLRAARRLVATPGIYTLTGFATQAPVVADLAGTIQFRRLRTNPMRVVRLA